VFTGDCNNLVCVANPGADDDGCAAAPPGDPSGFRSTFTWCTDMGVTYYILVGAYSTTTLGTFPFALTQGDNCHINCAEMVVCGTPAEVEPNDACPPPAEQPMIGCPGMGCDNVAPIVYGKYCPISDVDWWAVCVPALSNLTLTPYQGANCDVSPVTGFNCQFYSNCTTTLGSAFTGAFSLLNSSATPAVVYLKIAGTAPAPYKLVATCCPLVNPCVNATVIGGVTHFNTTVSTCDPCGSINIYPCVYSTGCASGSCYGAGPAKVFKINLLQNATNVNIIATGGDLQILVFTDCADPTGTCVASVDNYTYANGEALSNLALPAGIYYIAVDFYSSSGTTCGNITLDITSDVMLPVEMGDVSIAPLDNAVALTWVTRSETNLDKWIVKRDNVAVYQVNANNGSTNHRYSFTDVNAVNGRTYSYDLIVRNSDGTESVVKTLSATPTVGAGVVDAYALHQNYPNPFNPTTDIVYDVKEAGLVTLKVYNLMGQDVATLVNGNMTQGRHTVSFNATDLPSGLYLCKMTAGSFTAEIKMLLMK
jgi:hypothetical protein